jgi:hypothetical protein
MAMGVRCSDIAAASAYRYHQFDFMVQIGRERGVGHVHSPACISGQHGTCGFHEKEGGLTPGVAHFFGVVFVVAAYAVNAVYRKPCSLAGDGHAGDGWRGEHKAHGQLQL